MSLVVMTLMWGWVAVFAAALLFTLAGGDNNNAGRTIRSFVAAGVLLQFAMFAAMIVSKRFPADYELMNSLCKSGYTALILLLFMGRHEKKLTTVIGIAVVLFYTLSRVYISKNLGLQDGLAKNFGIFTLLFYQASAVSMGFFGYVFAISVSRLVYPETNGGRRDPLLFTMAFWGFIMFSACQLFGSIWSLTAGWGDVWVWATSHFHSAVIWIIYAALLHTPSTNWLSEKTAPVLGVVGFSFIAVYLFYHEYIIQPAYLILFT